MKIVVFDVPAESGGALSILEEYYDKAVECSDKGITWLFVMSLPSMEETDNVRVLRFPWVKKSWLHRLYFDYVTAPNLVAKHRADRILSLQNVTIPRTSAPQTIYVHQSLLFVDKRYRLSEHPLLWIYQNVIGKRILKSMQKADRVIVQTNWMRDACINKAGIGGEKIEVSVPSINADIERCFRPTKSSLSTFFYPASGWIYKNHEVIVKASILLKERRIADYRIVFTLQGDENRHIRQLYEKAREERVPIEFIGKIAREEVFDYYTRSVLIFASYIETFGLPMLEAKLHGTPVIASDCPFSHEILDGYEKASFFGPEDPVMLADLMETMICKHANG